MENDLARRFAEMLDDELLDYFASTSLNEDARALLVQEMGRRGLLSHMASHAPDTESNVREFSPEYRQLVRGLSPLNAHILLGRLHADGIDAHLSGVNIVQVDPLWFYALGGVRIFVHKEYLGAAFDVLNATWKGAYEVADAEEAVAPDIDSLNGKRQLGWKIVLWVALVIGGVSLAALWWPSYQQFSHPTTPAPHISVLGRGMASVLLLTYIAFWLCFVESVVRRQRRP